MKNAYPVILTPEKQGFTVFVPDFNVNTQGRNLAEALEMARDAIGIMGVDIEDDGEQIPAPSTISAIHPADGEFLSLVDVNFAEYRRRNELKVVKKNCTVPSWLCYEAEKAGINFSQALQNELRRQLNITDL